MCWGLQLNNTAAPATLALAFAGLTVINGVRSGNVNLQQAVVSTNNVAVNVGGGVPTIYPTLTGGLQVGRLCWHAWCITHGGRPVCTRLCTAAHAAALHIWAARGMRRHALDV